MNTLCILTALTSAEWAAWVQAVGSVLAILVAVWVAAYQKRSLDTSQRRERRAKSEQLLASALTFAIMLVNEIQGVADAFSHHSNDARRRSYLRLEELLLWGRSIDLTSTSARAAQALVSLRGLGNSIVRIPDETDISDHCWMNAASVAHDARCRRDDLMNAIEEAGFDAEAMQQKIGSQNSYLHPDSLPDPKYWRYPEGMLSPPPTE